MANGHRNKGAGGAGHRDQTTRANEPPIDLNTISPEELNRPRRSVGQANWQGKLLPTKSATSTVRSSTSASVLVGPIPTPKISIVSLIFLKPKLAYASGRQNKLRSLRNVLVQAIDSVVTEQKS